MASRLLTITEWKFSRNPTHNPPPPPPKKGGDLRVVLSGSDGAEYTWYRRGKAIALDIVRGLTFLHAVCVSHRDLKSKNILLTARGCCARIGNVGMARVMADGYFRDESALATFAWAAPELLMGKRWGVALGLSLGFDPE